VFIRESNSSPRKYSFLEEEIIHPMAVSYKHFSHGGVQAHEEEQPAATLPDLGDTQNSNVLMALEEAQDTEEI
jgi:hypothetical protein